MKALVFALSLSALTLSPSPLTLAFDHPIPVDPLTAVDPFNPYSRDPLNPDLENLNYWTNDRQPPPEKDLNSRNVYLQTSGDHPYASFFTISGRPCGYLYADAEADLPPENAEIRLSARTSVTYLVVQVSTIGVIPGRRNYAYICATDGVYHSVPAGSGRWVMAGLSPAEVGLPLYVDGGILAPPQFYEIPSNVSNYLSAATGCQDHVEWRSFDSQFSCEDYRPGGQNYGFCTDMGYYDQSLLQPDSDSASIKFGVPAYLGCPSSCGNCFDCVPLNNTQTWPIIRQNRMAGTNVDGCSLGYECEEVVGVGELVNGQRLQQHTFPLSISSALEQAFEHMRYNCSLRDITLQPLPHLDDRKSFTIDPTIVRQGWVSLRVVAPSMGSQVRYTLDGSEPSVNHGEVLASGGTITIKVSGQLKARAVRPIEDGVTVKQSRVIQLPFVRIQNSIPEFRILQVGHYLKAQDNRREVCSGSFISSEVVDTFRVIKSNGCPNYDHWQTEDEFNIALHQAWELRVPVVPVLAHRPIDLSNISGPIGMAKNGVPFFAPPPSTSDVAWMNEQARRDDCGGLAMSVSNPSSCDTEDCVLAQDYHGQYHYRSAPSCLLENENDGHSGVLGYMMDGIPIYGPYDMGGVLPQDLDECGGHTDSGRKFYHYHTSNQYTIKCLKGCIETPSVNPVNMELAQAQDYCHPSNHQALVAQPETLDWVARDSRSEMELLMAGNYSGSVSVEIRCEPAASGGATVRYTTDGTDPVVGGAPGQGYGLGAVVLVISESSTIKALCEAPDTEPSFIATSGRVDIQRTAYNPTWAATVAYVNFTDVTSYFGSYLQIRSTVQGVCSDTYDTSFSPAFVGDKSNVLGAFRLVPPDCKSKVAGWDVPNQPSLLNMTAEVNGVQALVFGGPVSAEGLRVDKSVTDLVDEKLLPTDEMSIEVWATIAGTGDGALASTVLKDPGFLGKGFYLAYEQDVQSPLAALHTITFVFGISTERNDNGGRGGLATVRATFPKMEIGTQWTHVVATYDRAVISLYVNGELAATNAACPHPFCGRITYPVLDAAFVRTDIYFRVGISQLLGKVARHEGAIAYLRVMKQTLSPEAVLGGFGRLSYGFRVSKCTPGTFGAYDGLQPCMPCSPGSSAPVFGMSECEPCSVGYYASEQGAEACSLCPDGVLTPHEGASDVDQCTGPDFCSIGHNCHAFATCTAAPGSFTCTCAEGFQGDGVECSNICGDGMQVEGEDCDDGNTFNSDGCDSLCRKESGFSCTMQSGNLVCSCELSGQECCVRSYANCLSSTEGCESSCFHSLANCLKQNQGDDEGQLVRRPPLPASRNTNASLSLSCPRSLFQECSRSFLQCLPPPPRLFGHPSPLLTTSSLLQDNGHYAPNWLAINETSWDQENTRGCDRNAMKACRVAYARCRFLSGNEDAADEEEECTSLSCVASYSECMQQLACTHPFTTPSSV